MWLCQGVRNQKGHDEGGRVFLGCGNVEFVHELC